MEKEKMIKLIEALTTAGYDILKIENINDKGFGDIILILSNNELLKTPMSQINTFFSKERMIKLINIFYPEYWILKYEILHEDMFEFLIVLQSH